MVREIPLSQGQVALIDDEDAFRVVPFKWSAVRPDGRHWYGKRVIHVDGKTFNLYLHRYILAVPDAVHVDHINGDGLDNRRENLRIASRRQNLLNSKGYGTSGYKYVTAAASGHGFRVNLKVNGRVRSFGRFEDAKEAARVADAAARHFFGEFAWTNFDEITPEAIEIVERVIAGGEKPGFQVNPNAVLSNPQAREIREKYASGVDTISLSREFGICRPAVYHVLHGRTFKDAGGPLFHRGRAVAGAD